MYLSRFAAMGMDVNKIDPLFQMFASSGFPDIVAKYRTRAVIQHGIRLFTLPDSNLLVEDIGFDPLLNRWILSSVHENKVVECDLEGKCADLIGNSVETPMDAVLAVRVDPSRKVLWITTVAMNMQAGFRAAEQGRSAILKFDMASHKLIRRYEPADERDHALGDMTVALLSGCNTAGTTGRTR
jgi:hypothetical protein